MDVNGFKRIFWPEYLHRMLGRSIGLVYVGPMAYFWARGYFKRRLKIMTSLILTMYGV